MTRVFKDYRLIRIKVLRLADIYSKIRNDISTYLAINNTTQKALVIGSDNEKSSRNTLCEFVNKKGILTGKHLAIVCRNINWQGKIEEVRTICNDLLDRDRGLAIYSPEIINTIFDLKELYYMFHEEKWKRDVLPNLGINPKIVSSIIKLDRTGTDFLLKQENLATLKKGILNIQQKSSETPKTRVDLKPLEVTSIEYVQDKKTPAPDDILTTLGGETMEDGTRFVLTEKSFKQIAGISAENLIPTIKLMAESLRCLINLLTQLEDDKLRGKITEQVGDEISLLENAMRHFSEKYPIKLTRIYEAQARSWAEEALESTKQETKRRKR
jgi:hypothetical protein